MFSSNHGFYFWRALVALKWFVYLHFRISSASKRPPGKLTSNLQQRTKEEAHLHGRFSWPIQASWESDNSTWEAVHKAVELVSTGQDQSLAGLTTQSLSVSALLYLLTSSVFQKVASTVYRCDSVMQIVFSVYLIWCWQEQRVNGLGTDTSCCYFPVSSLNIWALESLPWPHNGKETKEILIQSLALSHCDHCLSHFSHPVHMAKKHSQQDVPFFLPPLQLPHHGSSSKRTNAIVGNRGLPELWAMNKPDVEMISISLHPIYK